MAKAKKKAPKKAPKKKAAPRKAPKKAAPKQATPKKAAAKKSAPKQAAPKQAAPKQAAPEQAPAKAPKPAPVEAPAAAPVEPDDGSVKAQVLDLFRGTYGADDWPEDKILGTDPNEFDLDPGPFYEQLQEVFNVADDPNNQYFGGFGGKISATIAFIEQQRATGGAAPSEPEEAPIDDEE